MIKFNKDLVLNYNAEIQYYDQVCLQPFEFYTQIDDNILLEGQYNAYVIDCNNEIIEDITNQFIVQEQPIRAAYEFFLINEYYQPVRILIKQLINQEEWYSTPFVCYQNNLTIRLDYREFGEFEVIQSTRLNAYFTTLKHESELKTYVQERGTKVSNRAILTEFRKFNFDHVNNFIFRELNYALANPIVYIDGIRITDKPLLKDGDIEGSSNFFTTNFEGAVDNSDTYKPTPQIFQPFAIVSFLPTGLYSTGSGLPDFEFNFNRLFTIETTEPIKVFKDNLFLFDLQGLVVNGLTLDATEDPTPINDAGVYKIVIPANKIKSIAGELLAKTELEYTIRAAQFNGLQFNNNQFLTN